MGPEALIVFVGLLVGYAVLAIALAKARDRLHRYEIEREMGVKEEKRLRAELAAKEKRCIRLEQMLRERDPFIAKLQSLHDRGWRVVVKSHAFQKREDGSAKRDAWGWLVTVMPVDRARYTRWQILTGAVMETLEDAMGDTERRVAQIEAVEASERS